MLWIFVILAVALALLSLRGEGARTAYYRRWLKAPPSDSYEPATVIVPVKGFDEGLRENLKALATQDYPDYELIIVSRSAEDLPDGVTPAKGRILFAGPGDQDTGEKVNNLQAAVQAARTSSKVFVFADSDGVPSPRWLRALVDTLREDGVGASTGFRWHVPDPVDTWSLLRSVWNAVIAGGMGPGANSFCWGGATAIRRDVFERLQIQAWWRGAVSDDYRLSEAVKAAGLRIAFAPAALVASTDHTTAVEFLPWSVRQMKITRFYAPGLWKLALFEHVVYCTAMAASVWLVWQGSLPAALALTVQLGAGWYKGANRVRLARQALPQHDRWFARYGWLHVLLVPVGTWLWLYSCVASAGSARIRWRGRDYVLRQMGRP
jgi:ceramide glucosyltransferase